MIFHSGSNFASRNDKALLQKGTVFIIDEAGQLRRERLARHTRPIEQYARRVRLLLALTPLVCGALSSV
jgi:hypothetical protein